MLLDLARTRIVGGTTEEATRRAVAFYESALEPGTEIRALANAEAAEMTKLAETTYRDVNIALANEFAQVAARRGIDVTEVIDAANSQPYSHIHQPGVGVGGHCIPVYPHLLFSAEPDMQLPPMARAVNDGMAAYAVGALAEALGSLDGAGVLVLGIAYRGDVHEDFFSSAFGLRDALAEHGARVYGHDPYFDDGTPPPRLEPYDLSAPAPCARSFSRRLTRPTASTCGRSRSGVVPTGTVDRQQVEAAGARYIGVGR